MNEIEKEIMELHKQGMTQSKIAETLNKPLSTINYQLKNLIKKDFLNSQNNEKIAIGNDLEVIGNDLEMIGKNIENTPKALENEVFVSKLTIFENQLNYTNNEIKITERQVEDYFKFCKETNEQIIKDEITQGNYEKQIKVIKEQLKLNDIDLYKCFHINSIITKENIDNLSVRGTLSNLYYERFQKFIYDIRPSLLQSAQAHQIEVNKIEENIRIKKNELKLSKDFINICLSSLKQYERTKRQILSNMLGKSAKKNSLDIAEEKKENQQISEIKELPKIMKGKNFIYKSFLPPIKLKRTNDKTINNLVDFLGKITREMFFCSITGDAGAGKSEFTFLLSKVFSMNNYKILYLSLEMGINAQQQKRMEYWSINPDFFDIADKMDIEQLKQVAEDYDVIFIDSYGKLNAEVKQIDELRQDFPKVMFFSIFQKTTTGTMRGGASTLFDSTMNIDLKVNNNQREAVMVKSRYETQGKSLQIPHFKQA